MNKRMELNKNIVSDKKFYVEKSADVKENDLSSNNNLLNGRYSTNLYSLHDPYDINHIHGLRNRMYKTFNEFANVIENVFFPPVFKKTKTIKMKECDQKNNNSYISDLNLLLAEIKGQSRNENLYCKKGKTNALLRENYQMKLIQCYKLAINITKVCSKTIEAEVYDPIQNKLKNLIQIISTLSLTAGKYLYGEFFKRKRVESFDLVQRCKVLKNLLNECGYEDSNKGDQNNNHENYTLNKFANKALSKTKIELNTRNSDRLAMYNQTKPKLCPYFARPIYLKLQKRK